MNIKELQEKGKISEGLCDLLKKNPNAEIEMHDRAYSYASMSDISDWGGEENSVGSSILADIVDLEFHQNDYIEIPSGEIYIRINWGEFEISLVKESVVFSDDIYIAYGKDGKPIYMHPYETYEEAEKDLEKKMKKHTGCFDCGKK